MHDAETYPPFDRVAEQYDRDFTDTPLGRRQRAIVHAELEEIVRSGMRVLELNCGTGEDALWMASRGADVLATDISSGMLDAARRKVDHTPHAEHVRFRQMSIDELADESVRKELGEFDLILSNFDGLNCLPSLAWLPDALASLLMPHGEIMLVFMNPFCLMESLYHLVRGRPGSIFQRMRKEGLSVHIGDGVHMRTWFHSVGRVRRLLAPRFIIEKTMAVALTTPPTLMRSFYSRHEKWFRRLFGIEDLLAQIAPFNRMGDHVMIHARRRD